MTNYATFTHQNGLSLVTAGFVRTVRGVRPLSHLARLKLAGGRQTRKDR